MRTPCSPTSRRRFLQTSLAGLGSSLLAAPLPGESVFGLEKVSPKPVTIARIELLRRDKDHFVRTVSSDGVAGIHITNGREYLHPIFKEVVAPYFLNKDARQVETLVDGVYRSNSNYKLAGLAFWNCVGWMELSLLDLLGQVANKPVAALLGGMRRKEIPVYLSSTQRDITPEKEADRFEKRLAETGAKAVKFKVGGRMSVNEDAAPGRTESIVPLMRKRLGDDMTLYVDANGSFDAQRGIEVGRLLEAHGVDVFEEPCPFDEYEQTKQVADALEKVKLAGGEQDTSLARFRWIARNRALDLVQPDISYNGGMLRALLVARLAAEAGLVGIAPHNPKTGAREAHLLQFAACVPNLYGFQEYHVHAPAAETWCEPKLEVKNGALTVPTGPGMGITIDPDLLRKAERV